SLGIALIEVIENVLIPRDRGGIVTRAIGGVGLRQPTVDLLLVHRAAGFLDHALWLHRRFTLRAALVGDANFVLFSAVEFLRAATALGRLLLRGRRHRRYYCLLRRSGRRLRGRLRGRRLWGGGLRDRLLLRL